MPLIYTSPQFLEHHTGTHPESASRLKTTLAHIQTQPVWNQCQTRTPTPAPIQAITQVHDSDYIAWLQKVADAGGGRIETDTIMSPKSWEVARLAAGTALNAVDAVLNNEATNACGLVRPPGHHALADAPMGFCLLNSIAIAAQHALTTHSLQRILIVDFDVHHGNGTQDIFYRSPEVYFFSSHRSPFYPGTGETHETGSGPGLGTSHNLPLTVDTPRHQILNHFSEQLHDFAEQAAPQLILLSAGFDAHHEDPVGGLGLSTRDFYQLTKTTLDVARTHCNGRLVSLLEGGYHPQRLAESLEQHLIALADDDNTTNNNQPA